ncbi:hypothetical protein L9G15_25910, partial [Shewanella sp. A3A]|nr:hypothetical protein [Shewanella ferrihydritica]
DREHADDARADELRISNTGVPVNGLVEHEVFPDGSVGWVLTNQMPFRDREGNMIGTFGMSSYVIELVNAKQELERERYLLRS